MPLLVPPQGRQQKRGGQNFSTKPWTRTWQAWALVLRWSGLCCHFGKVTLFLRASLIKERLEENMPETPYGLLIYDFRAHLENMRCPKETGWRGASWRKCLNRGLLWVRNTWNLIDREPNTVESCQQVGRGTGLRVVGIMIQIGKAVLGDFNRGLTRLFQRSQGKVLIWCKLCD